MRTQSDPRSPPKARIKPMKSQTRAPLCPMHPSLYVSPVICPVDTELILQVRNPFSYTYHIHHTIYAPIPFTMAGPLTHQLTSGGPELTQLRISCKRHRVVLNGQPLRLLPTTNLERTGIKINHINAIAPRITTMYITTAEMANILRVVLYTYQEAGDY